MNRKKIVVGLAGGVAAFSLIGAGVGASFTDKASASQTITRGFINLQMATDATNYAKTVSFTDPGPVGGSATSVPQTLSIRNNGDVTEKLAGLVLAEGPGTPIDVKIGYNGQTYDLGSTSGSTNLTGAGISLTAHQVISVAVTYTLPAEDENFGNSMNPAPTVDQVSSVSLTIHGTD
jgi:predicted ribosomally synthesized peptide with SipW-like signal peptide